MNPRIYTLYGFNIESELPLSAPAAEISGHHVRIFYHPVAENGIASPHDKSLYSQSNQDHYWLNIPSVGRFLVSHGQSVQIDPVSGATEDDLRFFLQTLCFEPLLKQRGIMLLPGFILNFEGKTAAITGISAFPFQQLALLFFKQGGAFLNTRHAAVNKEVWGLPGFPHFELWGETAAKLKIPPENLTRLRPEVDRFIIPLQNNYYGEAQPLDFLFYIQKQASHKPEICLQEGLLKLISLYIPTTGLNMGSLAEIIRQQLTGEIHVTA